MGDTQNYAPLGVLGGIAGGTSETFHSSITYSSMLVLMTMFQMVIFTRIQLSPTTVWAIQSLIGHFCYFIIICYALGQVCFYRLGQGGILANTPFFPGRLPVFSTISLFSPWFTFLPDFSLFLHIPTFFTLFLVKNHSKTVYTY